MSNKLNVVEALKDLTLLSGEVVTIEGFLVERAPEYHLYLAPDEESIDEYSESIRVVPPISLNELGNSLPEYVGSRYSYADPTVVTGRLEPSDNGVFPALITDIDRLIVHRSGEIIDVLLEP